MSRATLLAFVMGFALIPSLYLGTHFAFAQSEIEKLKDEINDRSNRLSQIEQEIAQYEAALLEVGAEKSTLQKAINQLELERKKVTADIKFTETKIGSTDLEISKLNIEIDNTEENISDNQEALREIIRSVHTQDEQSLIETLLSYDNISDYWNSLEELESVRSAIGQRVDNLSNLKDILENKRQSENYRRGELIDLKDQYSDQQSLLTNNKAEKDSLLKETKNQEAEYQSLLAQKRAAQEQIEREMRDFEAKLQFILDPNSVPTPGTSVFNWPFQGGIITQYFGGTEFAKRNASVYGGRAYHPGLDIAAPRGTSIYAPLGGTVRDIGNTDLFPGCYSWGKWTLIDHPNGLSTLYAHQDLQSVTPGETVATGDIIGYTGNTGFSTGPHLHFTVYATAGVSIRKFNEIKTVTSCGSATTPIAATDAYLDPMLYLPQ